MQFLDQMGYEDMPKEYVQYSPEVAQAIVDLVAMDYTYDKIAQFEGMPCAKTISHWLHRYDDFQALHARARITQADAIEQKIAVTAEMVLRGEVAPDAARVALSALQWRASKKNPKVYGDRQILAGDAENPLQLLAARLDHAVAQHEMIDVTPREVQALPPADGSDLV